MKKRHMNLAKKLLLNKEIVTELGADIKAKVKGGAETIDSTPACCVWLPTKAPSCVSCVPATNPCGAFTCPITG